MKNILMIFMMALAPVEAGEIQEAKHSSFTNDQLAKHLGLGGGNWEAGFDEKCFLGFVITQTIEDGTSSKKFYWSSDASKKHEFHFMHHVESTSSESANHAVIFSSNQIGEWKKEGGVSTMLSGSNGFTYNTSLPTKGGSEERTMQNSFRPKMDEPTLLYSWTSAQSKQAFQLDVIFSVDKKEAERTGADQPTTKPSDKAPAEVQQSTPTSKDALR